MAHLIHSVLPNPRRPIIYIDPKLSVIHCANLMTSQNIGALVVREGDQLLGMVTERDIVRTCIKPGLILSSMIARDVAYADVSILSVDDPVEEAMAVITNTKRRHILVEEKGEIVALLSIGDLLLNMLDNNARVIQHLENYIHN